MNKSEMMFWLVSLLFLIYASCLDIFWEKSADVSGVGETTTEEVNSKAFVPVYCFKFKIHGDHGVPSNITLI